MSQLRPTVAVASFGVGILMKHDQTSLRSAARLLNPVVQQVSAPRQRLLPAFLTGSTIFFVGAVLFAGEFAGANGAWKPPFDISAPAVVEAPVRLPVADRPVHLRRKFVATATANAVGGRAICVRLCDGFFFPSVITSGSDEACASQCPDAPTAFYSEPAGSDKIEDAVSLSGAPTPRWQWRITTSCRSTILAPAIARSRDPIWRTCCATARYATATS